jgi:hypothetical protein
MRRPISISIIAWWLILSGIFGAIFSATMELSPAVLEMAGRSPVPIAIQEVYGLINGLVIIACGIGFLKGVSWSRLAYLAWSMLGFIYGFFVSPGWAIVAIFVFYAVVLSILSRRSANLWFENSGY